MRHEVTKKTAFFVVKTYFDQSDVVSPVIAGVVLRMNDESFHFNGVFGGRKVHVVGLDSSVDGNGGVRQTVINFDYLWLC